MRSVIILDSLLLNEKYANVDDEDLTQLEGHQESGFFFYPIETNETKW